MASFEGPAPSTGGGELLGAASSPMTSESASAPEAPSLTPERAQQELARLTAIIKENPNLNFLEPRVVKCMETGTHDSLTFLSFYRLISQSLSEELVQQRERIKALEDELLKVKQHSSQSQMEAALAEAAQAVSRATSGAPAGDSTAPSASEAPSPQVDELLKRLDQAEVQRERLLQDMQNMRNRNKTDVDIRVFKAVEKFTQSLLPALDAFHQAMPTLKNSTDTASIVTGIEMIHEQLQSALVQAGLKRMDAVGSPFDPRLHEAVGEVHTGDVPDDHVYDELQPGYMFGERMIRAAVVRIARNDGSIAPTARGPAETQAVQTADIPSAAGDPPVASPDPATVSPSSSDGPLPDPAAPTSPEPEPPAETHAPGPPAAAPEDQAVESAPEVASTDEATAPEREPAPPPEVEAVPTAEPSPSEGADGETQPS